VRVRTAYYLIFVQSIYLCARYLQLNIAIYLRLILYTIFFHVLQHSLSYYCDRVWPIVIGLYVIEYWYTYNIVICVEKIISTVEIKSVWQVLSLWFGFCWTIKCYNYYTVFAIINFHQSELKDEKLSKTYEPVIILC